MYKKYDLERLKKVKEFINNIPNYIEQGKIEQLDYKTSDFYNPLVDGDNKHLKANASVLMDQIRKTEISDNFSKKKESVKSVGIQDRVLVIPMNDPSSHYQERLIDGTTRITSLRDVEKERGISDPNPDVPVNVVRCSKLADFVRAHKEEIQNILNDPLPHDANSKETAKDWIRSRLKLERNETGSITKEFLKEFRPYVQEQYKNNRTKSTIDGWISEVKNEINVDNSPITSYREKGLRETKVKTDLKKINKKLVDPAQTRHYSFNLSTGSMFEKLIGTELSRQSVSGQKNIESVLVIHSENHTSEEKLLKSLISFFDKLRRLEKHHELKIFHNIYVMDQVDKGDMLGEYQIRERYHHRYSEQSGALVLKAV